MSSVSATWVTVATGTAFSGADYSSSSRVDSRLSVDSNFVSSASGNNYANFGQVNRYSTELYRESTSSSFKEAGHVWWGLRFESPVTYQVASLNKRIEYKICPSDNNCAIAYQSIPASLAHPNYFLVGAMGAGSNADENYWANTNNMGGLLGYSSYYYSFGLNSICEDSRPWVCYSVNPQTDVNVVGIRPVTNNLNSYRYELNQNYRIYGGALQIEAQCTSGDCCLNNMFRPAQTLSSWQTCDGDDIRTHNRVCSGSSGTSSVSSSITATPNGCEACVQVGDPETSTASFSGVQSLFATISEPSSGWYNSDPQVTYSMNSCFDTCEYNKNSAGWDFFTCGTTPLNVGTFGADGLGKTIRIRGSDSVTESSLESDLVTFDLDKTLPSLSLTSIVPLTGTNLQHVSGNTIYYNPSASGSFRVTASASDNLAGIQFVLFSTLSNFLSGGGSYTLPTYFSDYTFGTSANHNGAATIIAYDNAGNHRSITYNVLRDVTPPTGVSLSYTDGYVSTVTQTITKNVASRTDAGAGVDDSTLVLERSEATLSEGVCGTFGLSWTSVDTSLSSTFQDTLESGKCYRYRIRLKDRVNNEATFSSGNILKVDSTPPTYDLNLVSGEWRNAPADLIFTCADAESGCKNIVYCIDSSNTCSPVNVINFPGATLPLNNEGTEYVRFKVVNNANGETSVQSFESNQDSVAPSASIINPSNNFEWVNSTTYGVEYLLNSPSAQACWYTIDGGITNNSITCGSGAINEVWSEGEVEVSVYVQNYAELIASDTRIFNVDATAPVINIEAGTTPEGVVGSNEIVVELEIIEPNLENTIIRLRDYETGAVLNTQDSAFIYPLFTFSGLSESSYYYDVVSTDFAGNSKVYVSGQYVVDLNPPIITFSDPLLNNSWQSENDFEVGFEIEDANLESCWYSLDGGITNSTLPCTFDLSPFLFYVDFEDRYVDLVSGNDPSSGSISGYGIDGNKRFAQFSRDLGTGLRYNNSLVHNHIGESLPFTLAVRYRFSQITPSVFNSVGGMWSTTDGARSMLVTTSNSANNNDLRHYYSTTGLNSDNRVLYSPVVLDEWMTSIIQYNGTHTLHYVNGVLEWTTATKPFEQLEGNLLSIGEFISGTNSKMTGDISSFMVLNDAYSISTVTDLLETSLSGLTSGGLGIQTIWPEGNTQLTVYANDSASKFSSSGINFNVDTIPPTGEISYQGGDYVDSTLPLYFRVNQGGVNDSGLDIPSIILQRRSAPMDGPSSCSSSWSSWTAISQGSCSTVSGSDGYRECSSNPAVSSGVCYEFQVTASDLVGNSVNISNSNTTKVDSGSPVVTITSPGSNAVYSSVPTIEWNADHTNIDVCWYSVNGGSDTLVTCDADISGVFSEGFNEIYVYSNNSLGMVGFDSIFFWVDSQNPVVNFAGNSLASGSYAQNSVFVNVSLYDYCPTELKIQLYEGSSLSRTETFPISSCALPETERNPQAYFSHTFSSLGVGTFSVNATGTDYFNRVVSSETRTYNLDSVAPVVIITSPNSNGQFFGSNINVAFTATDANLDSCWWNSGGANSSISCGTAISGVSWNQGLNTVTIYANDTFGNLGSAVRTFSIDTLAPDIILNPSSTVPGEYAQDWVFVNVSTTEANLDYIYVQFYDSEGDVVESYTGFTNNLAHNFTGLPEGTFYYTILIQDQVGLNANYESGIFTLDGVPPVFIQIFPPGNGIHYAEDIHIQYSVSDVNLDSCWYRVNGGAFIDTTCGANINSIVWSEGFNSIDIFANDTVGNTNSINIHFIKDTLAPTITIVKPNPNNTSKFFGITNVPFEIVFEDHNLFGYNVTCRNAINNVVEYSVQEVGLGSSPYIFTDFAFFSTGGKKICNVYASDSHTAAEFDALTQVKSKTLGLGEDKIVFDNGVVEFIYDSRNTIPLESLSFEKRDDRISPIIKISDAAKTQSWWQNLFGSAQEIPEVISLYWIVRADGEIYVRQDETNIPGHIVIVPNNNMLNSYWYDANTYLNFVHTAFEIVGNEARYHVSFPYEEFKNNNFTFQTNSLGGLNVEQSNVEFEITPGQTIFVNGVDLETGAPVVFNLSVTTSSGTTNYLNSDSHLISIPCSFTTLTGSSGQYPFNWTKPLSGCIEGNQNATFYESQLTVNVVNSITGNLISDVELNISKGSYFDSSFLESGSKTYFLSSGAYEINASREPFTDASVSGTLAYGESKTIEISLDPVFTTTVRRELTGEPFDFNEDLSEVSCVDGTKIETVFTSQIDADSYGCDGNFSTTFVCEDGQDGLSITYSVAESGYSAVSYANYTKPEGVLNNSYWRVRSDIIAPRSYQFSNHIGCFEQNPLQLRTNSTGNNLVSECYNGTGWEAMGTISSGGRLYYEDVVWATEEEVDNETFCAQSAPIQIVVEAFCPNKVVTNILNSTNNEISGIDCVYDSWLIRADYSTTSYFRTLIPDADSFDEDIFMLDLNQDSAVEVVLFIDDRSGDYSNGQIIIRKFVNNTKETVIQNYIDIESKVVLWLHKNQRYEVYSVNNNGVENFEGYLIADVPGIKYMAIPDVTISPGPGLNTEITEKVGWTYSVDKDNGTVTLNFKDVDNKLVNLRWIVFDYETREIVGEHQIINPGSRSLVIEGLSGSKTYMTELVIDHPYYSRGKVQEIREVWYKHATIFPGFEGISPFLKFLVAMMVIISLLLVFTQRSSEWAIVFGLMALLAFNLMGWLDFIFVGSVAINRALVGGAVAIFGLLGYLSFRAKTKRFE